MVDRTVYNLAVEWGGGWIPTPELACKIAKVLVCDYYDETEWDAVQPLDIVLEGDVWHISTRKDLKKDRRLDAEIAKRDGAIRHCEIRPASFDALEAIHVRMNEKSKKDQQRE